MIDKLIEDLHTLVTTGISGFDNSFALYRRLHVLSVIAYIREVNRELEKLSSNLKSEIELSALEIKYDQYLDVKYWQSPWLSELNNKIKTKVSDDEINQITDYLPNGVKGFVFTPNMVGSFKTAMHQFCDEGKTEWKDLVYAINEGLRQMWILLKEIQKKKNESLPYLYSKYWENLIGNTDKYHHLCEYKKWKNELSEVEFQHLKDKQMQALVKVLSSGFLSFRPNPTKRDVDRCKLEIDEDSLEAGFVLPENMKEQCARFEYFISWKDPDKNILELNYERLGKYTYEHHNEIGKKDLDIVLGFDIVIDAIHEDIAQKKPSLKKYLKNYEEKTTKELHKECAEILNCCKKHLKEEIRPTFLEEFLGKMLYDKDIKEEARKNLSGTKTKKKHLCLIIAALDCFSVFKPEATKSVLADTLGESFDGPNKDSICRYIEDFQRERKGNLYNWTHKNIDDLKGTPFKYPQGLL